MRVTDVRVVVQRVAEAAVRNLDVQPPAEARIGPGLLLLVGFTANDNEKTLRWMAEKCRALRIFADDHGALNRSVVETSGEILAVPNFTLYGDARKGRRPSFTQAAPPELASQLFEIFVRELRNAEVPVQQGFFQAHMHVELVNDGPVTLLLEA